MQRVADILERERDMNLLHEPLRTVRLFLVACWKAAVRYVSTHLPPSTLRIVIPVILFIGSVSVFWIDQPASHAFYASDANQDGFVTQQEVEHSTQGASAAFFPTGGRFNHSQFSDWFAKDPRNAARFGHGLWRETEYLLADAIWWLALGILSSVGLGTGMHSGLLFLFPHIYLACAAADSCGNSNYWTYPVNLIYGPRDRTFVCIGAAKKGAAMVPSIFARLVKVIPACVLWGAGTAIGEIPPYALSYASARQGRHHAELHETSQYDVLNRMKNWTLDKIQRYGFWAILLLAAWPNMAFDLCGMACGQFLMPFWTFFGATFIGKALIKVNMQAVFFVFLFSGDNIERVVRTVGETLGRVVFIPKAIAPQGMQGLVTMFVDAIVRARESIAARAHGEVTAEEKKEGGIIMTLMHWLVVAAVAWFAKSIVEALAQSEQEERDKHTLCVVERMLSQHSRKALETDEELRKLIERARAESSMSTQRHSVLDSFFIAASVVGAVVGVVWASYPLFTLSLSLGVHTFLCAHNTNEELSNWTLWAVRAVLAAGALYALQENVAKH